MSQVQPAILYMIFAITFLLFNFCMKLEDAAEMFQSSVQRILDTPWQFTPYKTIYDVKGGPEVYEWLTKTFLNQLYLEYPQPGDQQGYCTEVFKCLLDEGDADNDNQCAGSLRKGVDNCPSYMSAGGDCCEPCTGSSCSNFTVPVENGGQASTAVGDLSANCANEMPSWLEELQQWDREDANQHSVSDPDPVIFCPERMSKVNTSIQQRTAETGRMLMVAQHNRVLKARLTLKRAKIVDHTSKAFSNAYPKTVNSDSTDAYTNRPSYENQETFGSDNQYVYQPDKGFRNAGGFVSYINFDKSKDQVLSDISKLKRNFWFDLNQGSFVVEMLLFNGNVDRFLYTAFLFVHDFSGQTQVFVIVHQLDLSLHDPSRPLSYLRFLFYIVILLLFCIFVKTEVDDMTADYATYFSNFMLLVHVTSLVLCAYCIVQYLRIVFSYAYINFDFPMPQDEGAQQKDFEDLVNLANDMGTFMLINSVNLFLILSRCITLMTTLIPQSSVILNTGGHMKYNLVAYFTMFSVMVLGFTFAGYYLFGTRIPAYNTLTRALLSSLQLMSREVLRPELDKGDDELGLVYFVVFHLFFLIVQQTLVSVLIYGYDLEKSRIMELGDADKYPLKKHWRNVSLKIRRCTNWLFRWFVSLQQFLFDVQGGPTARPNWERVARLRAGRATKPRIRNVDYAQIRDKDGDDVDISTDVTLRAVQPFYRNGMMHYYVQDVKPEGPAQEFKVAQNTFRLVAIQRQGVEDRKHFRSQEAFEMKFMGDPQKLLKDAQESRETSSVTLEFEGGVQPLSRECGLLLFFICVFLVFVLQVSRIEDSFSASIVQENAVIKPQWYEYNPKRIMSLNSMETINTVESWVTNTILDKEFKCVTSIHSPEDCGIAELTEDLRQDWTIWGGAGRQLDPNQQPLEYTPRAVDGLSIGFIPRRSSVPIDQVVRMQGYNIGVMPNNHVRLTLQVACFQENRNARWAKGYPYQLDPVLLEASNCASEPCMQRMINKSTTCLNTQGEPRSVAVSKGSWSGVDYTFTQEGTYREMGGFAIGLGNTRAEGEMVFNYLKQDRLFRANSISFVFECVTYNGNLDMFVYTTVKFSQKGTGKFHHEVVTSVFPLNVFSVGSMEHSERWIIFNKVCFAFYIIAALMFTAYFIWDLSIQYAITLNLSRKWYMFIFDFFLEDWWNFVDLVSVILNAAVIESVLSYILVGGSLEISRNPGFRSWTLDYVFQKNVDLDTVDLFSNFQKVASIYSWFTGLSAVNGLFLLLRFAKYFGGLSALRLVMSCISSALNELVVMILFFLVMMMSFMFMFLIRFGVQYQRFSNLLNIFVHLWLFLNGRFAVDDLIHNSPIYFTFVFVAFEVVFLVLINMFLAAIVYRWKVTRRDAQEVTLWGAWQKLKEPFSLSVLSFDKGEKQEITPVKLDAEFWQKLSVLRHIAHLDESGHIKVKDKEEGSHRRHSDPNEVGTASGRRDDRDGDISESEAGSEDNSAAGGGAGFNFEKEDDRKRFLKVFKKAHMEIASQMCRTIVVARKDHGGGVDLEDDTGSQASEEAKFEDDFSQVEMIGIIEEKQPPERATHITKLMTDKLEASEHPAEEIWKDALVTVLEEAGALEKLQRFFRPLPMIKPTKPQELLNFKQKKAKMESRLNTFLRWLEEEARIEHYLFLKRMAQDKEKNLKQQSLVLTDYLESLDDQIMSLEKEIKQLERKNAQMRSHVSPLL